MATSSPPNSRSSCGAKPADLVVGGHVDVALFDAQPESERVTLEEERALALARVAIGDLVEPRRVAGLLEVGQLVDQHRVDHPLGTLTESTRHPDLALDAGEHDAHRACWFFTQRTELGTTPSL